MQIPTFVLEGSKMPRVVFSLLPSLMEKAYAMGITYFDLPSAGHLESFRALRGVTEDENLRGLCHVQAEEGVSLLGRPVHRFEGKVISTLKKNLFPPQLIQQLKASGVWNAKLAFPTVSTSEVLTEKEVDRLTFDPLRFDKALSLCRSEESPFLSLGGRYADWISGLGRIDLLGQMVLRIREAGYIPILSVNWASFILPKAKSIDVAAYSIPINRRWSLFDLAQTCALVKKFEKPLIGLNPFDGGKLLNDAEGALSFLFRELKIHGAIAEVRSEEEGNNILKALEKFPSVIPPRRTGSPRR